MLSIFFVSLTEFFTRIVISKLVHENTEAVDLRTPSEPSILNFFKSATAEAILSPETAASKGFVGPKQTDKTQSHMVSSEDISIVEVHHPESGADCDIDIPSLSQLHLSQVNQLPSPMKHSILSKIGATNHERKMTYGSNNHSTKDSHFLQTDMRRMMKLAAVKNGDESIPGSSDLEVSMTQLDSLPLEMQLQIANGDNRPLGLLPRKSRHASDSSSGRSVRSRVETAASDPLKQCGSKVWKESTIDHDAHIVIVDSDSDDDGQFAQISSGPTKQSYYQENIKPLMIFMDENDSISDEAVRQVLGFFHVVVADEGRHHEAVVLLRSVKRRADTWSGHPFELIFEKVNTTIRRTFGHELDRQMIEG